jgi:hypothetical protein
MQTVGPPHLRLVSALAEPTVELCKFEFLVAVKKVKNRQDTESNSSNDLPHQDMNQKVVRLSILCLRPIIHILVDCLEVKPSADFTPILRYDVWPPFFRSNLISTCLMGKCFTTLPRDLNGATARNYDVVVSISNNNISAVYLLAPMGVGIMALTHHYVFCWQGYSVPARVHFDPTTISPIPYSEVGGMRQYIITSHTLPISVKFATIVNRRTRCIA